METIRTQHLFLLCIAAIYFFAFASLYFQIPGLYGSNGILPAHLQLKGTCEDTHAQCSDWMEHDECTNNPSWMSKNCPVSCEECKKGEKLPLSMLLKKQFTLLWVSPYFGLNVENYMELLCIVGGLLSLGIIFTNYLCSMLSFLLLWLLYLSLYKVGQTFLWFQWDILLLETGFIATFVAPVLPSKKFTRRPYHLNIFWLVKWLLFRLMFASGVVKLTSLCPTWWNLTALDWHYESQCIPTPSAWYAHQLPSWFQSLSVVATYIIEIALPFFFFLPMRSLRLFSFYGQLLLQVLIILTGNYNFFNLLTCALCLSLIDDIHLKWWEGKVITILTYLPFSSTHLEKKQDEHNIASSSKFQKIYLLIKSLMFYMSIVYLFYWTKIYFNLTFKRGLHIDSKIAFSQDEFFTAVSLWTKIAIFIGIISFIVEFGKALYKSLMLSSKLGIVSNTLLSFLSILFTIWLFSVSLVPFTNVDRDSHGKVWPVIYKWYNHVESFEVANSYGLFRRMTGVGGRPELIIEGSTTPNGPWTEYHFLYKPGNLSEAPRFLFPHQPRLDWQMWFAALGSYQHNPWFIHLIYKLLHNENDVLKLLSHNPFPDKPPKFIRSLLYTYHYTRISKKSDSIINAYYNSKKIKKWWKRDSAKEYTPPLHKDEPSLIEFIKNQKWFVKEKYSSKGILYQPIQHLRSLVEKFSPTSFMWQTIIFFVAVRLKFWNLIF